MRFEDIAHSEVGVVLRHAISKRPAVLTACFGKPLYSIDVQYLDGDTERISGCNMESMELGKLHEGTLLREVSSGEDAVLVENSAGPSIAVRFIRSGKRSTTTLCQPNGKHMRVAFVIAPPPKGTVAHETPPNKGSL